MNIENITQKKINSIIRNKKIYKHSRFFIQKITSDVYYIYVYLHDTNTITYIGRLLNLIHYDDSRDYSIFIGIPGNINNSYHHEKTNSLREAKSKMCSILNDQFLNDYIRYERLKFLE